MRDRKLLFFILIFLSCLFECPSIAFGKVPTNREVITTILNYYNYNYQNYVSYYPNSNDYYNNLEDVFSSFDTATYYFIKRHVQNNQDYIEIDYVNNTNGYFTNNKNRISFVNGYYQILFIKSRNTNEAETFIAKKGKANSRTSQFDANYTYNQYTLSKAQKLNGSTLIQYYQNGYGDDEIFTITANEDTSDNINLDSVNFNPTYDRSTSVYVNGVYQPLYVNYYNRPPQFWAIGTLEGFDVNENTSPYFSQVTDNGSFKILDFSAYSAYQSWSPVSQSIYVDGMSLRYNVVYSFNLVDGNTVSTYYFLFQPKQNEGVVENDSGDYVFSGDAYTPGPTSEDYLSLLLNNDFDYSGDYLGFVEDNPIDYSGDYSPFYLDLVLKVVDVFVSSGDVEIEVPIYNYDGELDHVITFNSASARWDIPIISEMLSIFWTISFGIFALKFFISYVNLLLVGRVVYAAKKVESFVNVL